MVESKINWEDIKKAIADAIKNVNMAGPMNPTTAKNIEASKKKK